MKLSFKKEKKERGLGSIGRPNPDVNIRADGKRVGWISGSSYMQKTFQIWFHIKDEESLAKFRNAKMKFQPETEAEAREWIKTNWEALQESYQFHQVELQD